VCLKYQDAGPSVRGRPGVSLDGWGLRYRLREKRRAGLLGRSSEPEEEIRES
jgi:hypothetical protein